MAERDERPAESETGADPDPGADGLENGSVGSSGGGDGPGGAPGDDPADTPADGIVSIRGGLVGLGFIWLTAVSAFGTVGAAAYGVTTSGGYLVVAVVAAALTVAAGSASLRAFGYR